MHIYVCGPMSHIAEFNQHAFNDTAATLRAMGHKPFNPVAHDESIYGVGFLDGTTGDPAEIRAKGFDLNEALKNDLAWIADKADAVCVLPGWEKSRGARAEVSLADALHIPVAYLKDIYEDGVDPAFTVEVSPWSVTDAPVTLPAIDQARALTRGARQAAYGHPFDNFNRIARIWEVLLGVDVTPEQVAMCMVGIKLARQVHMPQQDNITDAIGYLDTLEMVTDERAIRESS